MVLDTDIETAIAHLRAGALVAIPTETVYGLAGDAMNPLAIRRIYATKGRPTGHPVIVHLGPDADPNEWGEMNPLAQTLAEHFWPGPLTLIVKRRPRVLDEVTGGLDTVGLRVPSHPVAQTLLSAFGGGLAAPSANRFGRISPTTAHHVQADLGSEVMVLDGGPSAVGIESTIIDVSENKPCMLRPGVIDPESIEACVGPLGISNTPAPGTLKSHYAPMTSLLLSHNPESDRKRLEAEGRTVAVLEATKLEDHARNLYGELRRLDALGVDILIAEMATNVGIGRAINDRLSRAATKLPTGQ
ncbi:MAG: threonylcarbamoyl-AMP synthase [Deltaproteobacteria bacterium]|jgi:L-threonylcarbamoyladenylate synthase|nr:threonylcarbamoyl-AMP synthase [Deltaproteobacteria bacterium]